MQTLLALIGLVLLAAGPGALLAPESAATAFGIALDGEASRAYLVATATRDVALGALLLGLLCTGATARVLATTIFAIAVVAAGDAANVVAHSALRWPPALIVHAAGFVVLLAVGWRLWQAGRDGDHGSALRS